MPPSNDQNQSPSDSSFTILHHTKNKYRQINSSLLLTSTLHGHKSKINKIRQQKLQSQSFYNPSALLTTNKLNVIDRKQFQYKNDKDLSSIEELKCQAKRLEEQKIIKMGKQNSKPQKVEIDISYTETSLDIPTYKIRQRKMNKRKIVKGRPDMLTLIKKRKFLTSLHQEQPKNYNSIQYDHSHIKDAINQILHKNHQAEIYFHKYMTPHVKNDLFSKFSKEDGNQLMQLPKNKRQIMRNSVSSFNTIQNGTFKNKILAHDVTSPLIKRKHRHHSLLDQRLSISNTIE